MIGDFGVNTFA
ncbi:putative membrane protein, partial [Vibrio harveyi]